MEELQQQIEEPVEEQAEERHPADTLNNGDPHKFFLLPPALFVHTLIATFVCPIGVVLASVILDMRPSYGRYFWPGYAMEAVFSVLMGYAWSKRLDRWLLGTSRAVWVVPLLWFVVHVINFQPDILAGSSRTKHFFGRVDDYSALTDQLYVVIPFLCAVGYALGARFRRKHGEVLYEKLKSLTAEPRRR